MFEPPPAELHSEGMTPQEKRELEAEAARLKAKVRRARAKRPEWDKRFDRAVMTLRELSGRA
jgi:hypothetical protein